MRVLLLNHQTDTRPGVWVLLGFFRMSEPESVCVCVCVHVLLPLVHHQLKRVISFSTNFASLLCPGRHHRSSRSPTKLVALISYIHPCVSGGEKKHLSDEHNHVLSHSEGPRAAKLEMTTSLNGYCRRPAHCG